MEKLNFNKKTDEELKGTELDYKDGKLNIISKSGEVLIDRGENKKGEENKEDKKVELPPHKLTKQNLEDIKNGKTEKIKVAMVDISDSIEKQAIDIAEARMTAHKKDLKGIGGWFSKVFKHNLGREVNRQYQIRKARKEIMESGNIYAGETGDVTKDALAFDEAKRATIGRFIEEYEGQEFEKGVRTGVGELRMKVEGKSPQELAAKEKVEKLLQDFAAGSKTEEQFKYEKDLVLKQLRDARPEHFDQGKIFADNLLEVAKGLRTKFEHEKGIGKIDLDFDMIIGRARMGARTETQMNALDKLVQKVNSRSFGALSCIINETTVGIAGSLAVAIGTIALKSKLTKWFTFGASVAASTAIAGYKEDYRQRQERKQHIRERTKGKVYEDDAERRKEMEKYRYATRDAKDLIASLDIKAKSGEMTIEQVNQALADLADIEARIRLSDQKKIDLISFSGIESIEKERWDMDVARAKAKVELRNLAEAGKLPLAVGVSFDKYLETMVKNLEDGVLATEIKTKDDSFKEYKKEERNKMMKKTLVYGMIGGAVAQEVMSLFQGTHTGIIEEVMGKGGSGNTLTPVAGMYNSVRSAISGNGLNIFNHNLHEVVLNGGHIKLPVDMDMVKNADGTFNLMRGAEIVKDHLKINPNGTLTDEARKALGGVGILPTEQAVQITGAGHEAVPLKDYLAHHPNGTTQIHRGLWFDNDTPKPVFDKNELGLHYGNGGTGIDPATGHYSYGIRTMTEGGSYHNGLSDNAIEAAGKGQLKMLISLDKSNPFKVFEVPIKADGTIDIDPNSEVGRLAFKVVNGHLQFTGGTAEVAHSLGIQPDGIEKFNIIATQEGTNSIGNIDVPIPGPATIATLNVPQDYDMPWFVPLVPRTPLELMSYKEKEKIKDKGPKSEKGPDNDKIPGKERPIGVEKPPEAVKEKIGKERPIPANERNLSEKIIEAGTTIALLKEKYGEEKDPKIKKEIQKEIDSQEKELEEDKKIQSIVDEVTKVPETENETKEEPENLENEEFMKYKSYFASSYPEINNSPRLYKAIDKFIKRDTDQNLTENPNSDTQRFIKLFKDKPEIIKVLETILDPKMNSKDFDKAIKDFNQNKSIPGVADIEQKIVFGNINEEGKSRRLLSIKIAKDGGVYLSPTR